MIPTQQKKYKIKAKIVILFLKKLNKLLHYPTSYSKRTANEIPEKKQTNNLNDRLY